MRIWYDTEFIERGPGQPIDLISIGMVREDLSTLYVINANAPWDEIYANEWLRENVLAHLPRDVDHIEEWRPDYSHPQVVQPALLRFAVSEFTMPIRSQVDDSIEINMEDQAELWAYYADYDHVILAQIFGKMIDLPSHIPMYTRDLKQAADMLMGPEYRFRGQTSTEHNALNDAYECMVRWTHLRSDVISRYAVDLLGGEHRG